MILKKQKNNTLNWKLNYSKISNSSKNISPHIRALFVPRKEKQMAKRRKLPNGTESIERVNKTIQGKTRLSQYRARLPAKYTKDWKKIQKDIGFFKTYNEALLNYK